MRSKIQIPKKILSVLLCALVLFSCVPMSVITASTESASDITVAIDTGAEVTLKDTDADDYYDIGTADELYAFAYAVNGGSTSINAELTADIVVNEGTMSAETDSTSVRHWTPIGNNNQMYIGNFNGNNHTISGVYFNNIQANYVGLFGCLGENSIVENVGVINSYFNASEYIGSVAGESFYGTIKNCYNTGIVNGNSRVGGIVGFDWYDRITDSYNSGEISGSDYIGGIAGYTSSGAIKNCYNTGKISGGADNVSIGGIAGESDHTFIGNSYNTGEVTGDRCVGGIVGIQQGMLINCYNTGAISGRIITGGIVGSIYLATIRNCYNTGEVTSRNNTSSNVVSFDYNYGHDYDSYSNVINCYYLADSELDEFDETTFKTKAQFESGEVAYLLQEGVAEDEYGNKPYVWGQIIGTDAFPKFTEYHTVYVGKNCKNEIAYTNIDTEYYDVILHSNFDEDGFCTDCKNGYKKPAVEIAEDGWSMVYLISNIGELYWLQDFVNSGMAGDCHAKLVADINLNEGFTFNSDGTYKSTVEGATPKEWTPIDNMYGNFDGNGHTISGIYCVSEDNYVGLFGYDISWNITNLTIANSYFEGNNNVGAISGYSENASYEGCVVKEDVAVKGNDNVGGIVGYMGSSNSIANCMSLATIICTDGTYGGIVGHNSAAISNSYTTNEIFLGSHSTYYGNGFTNCYYVSDIENEPYRGLGSISASAVTSGELAYKLQAGVKGEEIYDEESGEYITAEPKQIWGQKLGEDKYPVLSGDKVYYGYKDCYATEKTYCNKAYDIIPSHSFENGSCTICGDRDPNVKLISITGDITLALEETDANIFTSVIELEAGTYSFNVDDNGTIRGMNSTYTDKATINYSADVKTPSKLNATGGKYTFTYNASIKVLKIEPVELLGDVNEDGDISVSDVIFVMKHIVGTITLDEKQSFYADMNSDGIISVIDVIYIQKMILDMV